MPCHNNYVYCACVQSLFSLAYCAILNNKLLLRYKIKLGVLESGSFACKVIDWEKKAVLQLYVCSHEVFRFLHGGLLLRSAPFIPVSGFGVSQP